MMLVAQVLIVLVALLHFYFLVLEMFLWTTPYGLKNFHNTLEFAQASAPLAKNMGLYNGFLGAGLIWGLTNPSFGYSIKLFFLSCIVVAGIFGAVTANKKILFVQALPAALALGALVLAT